MSQDLAAIEAVSLLLSQDRLCTECQERIAEYSKYWTDTGDHHTCGSCLGVEPPPEGKYLVSHPEQENLKYVYRPATRTEIRICQVITGWLSGPSGKPPVDGSGGGTG
jgi:hypothetical protein